MQSEEKLKEKTKQKQFISRITVSLMKQVSIDFSFHDWSKISYIQSKCIVSSMCL